jgi:hypothetical protein
MFEKRLHGVRLLNIRALACDSVTSRLPGQAGRERHLLSIGQG